MFSPKYLCTSIRETMVASKANEWTGYADKVEMWKVEMIHGTYPGVGMTFLYEDEAMAREFAQWEVYTPGRIMEIFGTDISLTLESIRQTTDYNSQYDIMVPEVAWIAEFSWDFGKLWLQFKNEAEALRFQLAQLYTMLDLLGTLPAVDYDAEDRLQGIASQAKATEANIAQLVKKFEALAARVRGDFGAVSQEEYDALYSQMEAAGIEAASAKAQITTTQDARQQAYDASWHPPGRSLTPSDGWWALWFGGSGGTYDGDLYGAGQFHPSGVNPDAFLWFGTFIAS